MKIHLVPAFVVCMTDDIHEAEARAAQLAEATNAAARKEPDHDGTVVLLDECAATRLVEHDPAGELPHTYAQARAIMAHSRMAG